MIMIIIILEMLLSEKYAFCSNSYKL